VVRADLDTWATKGMAMLAKTKPDPPTFDFQAEKSAWLAIDAERKAKINRVDAMRLAFSLATEKREDVERLRGAGEHLLARRKAGAEFVDLAKRRPQRLRDMIADLEDDLADTEPAYLDAARHWEHCRSVETSRIAIGLQGRQREIARRISRALSDLSTACFEAEELAAQLRAAAPNESSLYLPAIAGDFAEMRLGDPFSTASRWLKRMKIVGVL
jgi:hypothetical protein